MEFPKYALEFREKHATTSRGFLISTSGAGDSAGHSACTDEGKSPRGEAERKVVAVKKLKLECEEDRERALGLTIKAAGVWAQLSHAFIVNLEGFVEDASNNGIWLISPWEENGNLKDFVTAQNWEIPERVSLIHDVVRGLEYLHSRNPPLCHGNLKSSNVLVNSRYRAVLTDLGFARSLSFGDKAPDAPTDATGNQAQPTPLLHTTICAISNTITLTGNRYSLDWAAPELLLSKDEPSSSSDIWALGWVLYGVMTDFVPLQDVQTETTVVQCAVQGDLPLATDHSRTSLIQALFSLMKECWSINPSKRPTTAAFRSGMKGMPMLVPSPQWAPDAVDARARHPRLLVQLGHLHTHQKDYTNAASFYTQALDIYADCVDDPAHRGQRAAALCGLGEVRRHQNEHDKAFPLYSEALRICADAGYAHGRGLALYGLAKIHALRGELDEAVAAYTEVARIQTELGDRPGKVSALLSLAAARRDQDEHAAALALYVEANEICMEIGDGRRSAFALFSVAEMHRLRKEYDQAVTFYSKAIQTCIDVDDKQRRASALVGLASVHRERKEYEKAVSFYSEAAQVFVDAGDREGKAGALFGLGEVYRSQSEYGQAIAPYSESLTIFTDVDDRQGKADSLYGLAEAHRALEQYDGAKTFYPQAAQIYSDVGDKQGRADSLFGQAEVHQALYEYDQAIALYSEVERICTEIGDRQGKADALWSLAETHHYQHQYSFAVTLYQDSIGVLEEIGDREGAANGLLCLAQVHYDQDSYSDAVDLYEEAAELFEVIGSTEDAARALDGAARIRREDLEEVELASVDFVGDCRSRC